MKTLDLEAVQAFVHVAELRSFTRAAEAMDSTQSAVSLRIRRLEAALGQHLVERTPRRVRLSAAGDAFLPFARNLLAAHHGALDAFAAPRRRLTVGISHHLVGHELPLLLRRVKEAEPALVMEVQVAASRELMAALDCGVLDAAIVLRHDNRRLDGDTLFEERFGWMAQPGFTRDAGEPVPLATQAAPCSVRSMAIAALARAGVPWKEVFVGGGVLTIGAAVAAGLAVAALGRRVAPPGTVDMGPALGLPPLPAREVVLHRAVSEPVQRRALGTLADAMRASVSR